MKVALLDAALLNTPYIQAFVQEHNIGCAVVSSLYKDIENPLDIEIFIQKDLSIQKFVFQTIKDKLIVFDTKTQAWKRYYFQLFSLEESDTISVLAEQINCSIDKFNAKYSGK